VLHRLQTTAPTPHVDGCRCLDGDDPDQQESLSYHSTIASKGEAMRTSTLEPLTMLAPSSSDPNSAGDEHCGCGCGCGVSLTQLALPQNASGQRGDSEHAQPKQP
jgi:hypothetical protein